MQDVVHQEHQDAEHWWFRARRVIFERVLDEHVELDPEARILDLGPGSGVNMPVLSPRGRVTVVDVSGYSLDACRAAGAELVVQADATAPPFADQSFDATTALDVLEHLGDDRAALRELRRVLKPGGVLMASVPAFPLLWGRQDVLSHHKRRYRRGELQRRLQEAGFEVVRESYFNTWLFAPILLVRLLMRPFLSKSVEGGSDLSVRLPFGLDGLLFRLFASEAGLVSRRRLPIGVSLLVLARPRQASL